MHVSSGSVEEAVSAIRTTRTWRRVWSWRCRIPYVTGAYTSIHSFNHTRWLL